MERQLKDGGERGPVTASAEAGEKGRCGVITQQSGVKGGVWVAHGNSCECAGVLLILDTNLHISVRFATRRQPRSEKTVFDRASSYTKKHFAAPN